MITWLKSYKRCPTCNRKARKIEDAALDAKMAKIARQRIAAIRAGKMATAPLAEVEKRVRAKARKTKKLAVLL